MTTTAKPSGLTSCVPVSTSETHGPESETCVSAINTLITWGWTLGCDGELLPPRWFRRGARG